MESGIEIKRVPHYNVKRIIEDYLSDESGVYI